MAKKPRLLLLLTVPFLLQILGSTVVVGWLSFRNSEQAVNRLAEQLMVSLSERIVGNLTTYLETPVRMVRFPDLGQIRQSEQFEIDVDQRSHFIRVQPLQDAYDLCWLIVIVVPDQISWLRSMPIIVGRRCFPWEHYCWPSRWALRRCAG